MPLIIAESDQFFQYERRLYCAEIIDAGAIGADIIYRWVVGELHRSIDATFFDHCICRAPPFGMGQKRGLNLGLCLLVQLDTRETFDILR